MSMSGVSEWLSWCIVVGYALLLVWFGVWVWAAPALHRLHSRWFRLERPAFDALAWHLLGLYKIALLVLFVIPWTALWLVRHTGGVLP